MTLLGQPLHDLALEHVRDFLSDADSEPLLWEAKSSADKKPIRKAICGFANGEQTGYLIIGAAEAEDGGGSCSAPSFLVMTPRLDLGIDSDRAQAAPVN